MTNREMQNSFELTVNKYDSKDIVPSHVIFYWLNKAQEQLVKVKYTGANSKSEAFEQSQKRIDDIRTLLVDSNIATSLGSSKPNSDIATLPTDYMFKVSEETMISFNNLSGNPETKRVGVKEATNDTYNSLVNDPYGEHILHYETAKPLRLFQDDTVELISDGNYQTITYFLRYIKYPTVLTLGGTDSELPEHMHQEIVDKAVNLYLESTMDPRYQSHKVELNNNE
jgi:hypothetical protein